jgi:hypothetical protein
MPSYDGFLRYLDFEVKLLRVLLENNGLPRDNPVVYPARYLDLRRLSRLQLEQHWDVRGRDEGRCRTNSAPTPIPQGAIDRALRMLDNIRKGLPLFFDASDYRQINKDLRWMSLAQSERHYKYHGVAEMGRLYAVAEDGAARGCVFLLNHETSTTGAASALYRICRRLKRSSPHLTVCLLEPFAPTQYKNAEDGVHVLYYCGDVLLLSAYVRAWNPQLVFSNSVTCLLLHSDVAQEYLHKCAFYFHEAPHESVRSWSAICRNRIVVAAEHLVCEYEKLGLRPHLYADNISTDTCARLRRTQTAISRLFWEDGVGGAADMLFILTCFERACASVKSQMAHLVAAVRVIHGERAKIVLVYSEDTPWKHEWVFESLGEDSGMVVFGGFTPKDESLRAAGRFEADAVLLTPNKGTDSGPFLLAAHYFEAGEFDEVVKIHSKTNALWRATLWDVVYPPPSSDCSTIFPPQWTQTFDSATDLNASRLRDWKERGLIEPEVDVENFAFAAGTCFRMPSGALAPILAKASEYYTLLSDEATPDNEWVSLMDSDEHMRRALLHFGPHSYYNEAMHPDCQRLRSEFGAMNWYQLAARGIRGLPDATPDHAIERVYGAYSTAFSSGQLQRK